MMVRVIIKEFPDNYIFPCNQAIGVTGTLYLSKEFCQSTWGRSSTRLQLLQTIVTVTVGLQLGSDKTHKHTSPVIILSQASFQIHCIVWFYKLVLSHISESVFATEVQASSLVHACLNYCGKITISQLPITVARKCEHVFSSGKEYVLFSPHPKVWVYVHSSDINTKKKHKKNESLYIITSPTTRHL